MPRVDVSVFVAVDGTTVSAVAAWVQACEWFGIDGSVETVGPWARLVDPELRDRFGWVGGTVAQVADWVSRVEQAGVPAGTELTAASADLGVHVSSAAIELFGCSDHLGVSPGSVLVSPHPLCAGHGPAGVSAGGAALSVPVTAPAVV